VILLSILKKLRSGGSSSQLKEGLQEDLNIKCEGLILGVVNIVLFEFICCERSATLKLGKPREPRFPQVQP